MMSEDDANQWAGPVLFFDAECGLCNRCVRILLRIDGQARLRFAPLQGPTAQAYLRTHGLPTDDFDSMVLVPSWARRAQPEFLWRTDAGLGALAVVGGRWRLIASLRVVPRPIRDAGYRVVAKFRYAVFGEWVPKPLAKAEWATRFMR
jgi:predicted DCC family thiol-disulfide oxidoreductase YuxK